MPARFPQVLVKGLAFRPAECKEAASTLAPGDIVYLERDLDNEFDNNAIRVLFFGFWIGFIEKEQAAWIGPEMDEDESAEWIGTVTEIKSTAKTIYPVVDVDKAPDERIQGTMNTLGTVSGRFSHPEDEA